MSSFVWTAPIVKMWFNNIRKTWVVILLYFQYYTFCAQRIRLIRVVVVVVVMVVLVVVVVVVGGSSSGGEAEKRKQILQWLYPAIHNDVCWPLSH